MTALACDGHTFELTPKQEAFLARAKERKMPFAYFDCSVCETPVKVELSASAPAPPLMRCPRTACTGWVSNVEALTVDRRRSRWGCGACGTVWSGDRELWGAVEKIVRLFPHRRAVYRKQGAGWIGVPLANEPVDHERTVESERAR